MSKRLSKPWIYSIAVILALAAGAVDMHIEYGSDLTILYLLPVLFVAWFLGGVSIAIVSIFCTLTWFAANVMSERLYADTLFSLWYFLAILGFFLMSGYLLAYIRRSL
jgi:hypothetical protein